MTAFWSLEKCNAEPSHFPWHFSQLGGRAKKKGKLEQKALGKGNANGK